MIMWAVWWRADIMLASSQSTLSGGDHDDRKRRVTTGGFLLNALLEAGVHCERVVAFGDTGWYLLALATSMAYS